MLLSSIPTFNPKLTELLKPSDIAKEVDNFTSMVTFTDNKS